MAVTQSDASDLAATDADGNDVEVASGGFRAGMFASPFGAVVPGSSDLYRSMYPIVAIHRDDVNKIATVLGRMDGVRGVDITNFSAESEINMGGDTWKLFPMQKKTTDDTDERTYNIGIAYRIDA